MNGSLVAQNFSGTQCHGNVEVRCRNFKFVDCQSLSEFVRCLKMSRLLMIVTREAGREAVFLDLVVRAIRHGFHLFALAHHGVVQHHIRFPHGSHVGQVGQVTQNKERTAGHPAHRIKQRTKQTTSPWDANQGRFRPLSTNSDPVTTCAYHAGCFWRKVGKRREKSRCRAGP